MSDTATAAEWAERLSADARLVDDAVGLDLPGIRLRIRSDSQPLLDALRAYFAHVPDPGDAPAEELLALEAPAPELDLAWTDWAREPGKSRRKDAVHDLADGRLLRKVRTGMVFLQSGDHRIAVGPCLANANQVINFAITQQMGALQRDGWLICHAAAVARDGVGLALAGFAGGGKSTTMLSLLREDDVAFVSNDRLFVKQVDGRLLARGVPKLPRVNPGTMLHDPALRPLLDPAAIARYEALPPGELWELEEKRDVDVAAVYGADRFAPEVELRALALLAWSHTSRTATTIEAVDLAHRPDLVPAVAKDPGPFYQRADGGFQAAAEPSDPARWQAALAPVKTIAASGQVDLPQLRRRCLEELTACATR